MSSLFRLRAQRWMIAGAARCIVLLTLFRAITPASPVAVLGPSHQVITAQPHVCVHTRLIEEVEEWKIQHTLELVREMGAGTIVEFFPWAYLEPDRDRYEWQAADRIVRHAQNQGIRIIARLGLVPGWARPADGTRQTTANELPEAAYPDFAQFAADFAQRYHDQIEQLIIWNEPNLSFEWGYRSVSADEYVQMLRTVYEAVKAVSPATQVLAAPLAPTLEPRGSAAGLDDLLYLEDLYRAGVATFSDGIALHTYGFTSPPDASPASDQLNFRRAELHRAIMQRYGDDAPVYITETGWNDHPRWTKAVSPSLRVAYTLEALAYGETEWDWAKVICLWVMRYPTNSGSYPDDFALVTPDFQLKPIFGAVQAYARGWNAGGPLWLPPPSGE